MMNHDVMRMTRPTSKARGKITLTFWQHFCTLLGCASCRHGRTRINTDTHTHRQIHSYTQMADNKHADIHQPLSFQYYILSLSLSVLIFLSPLLSHTNTQPLRWGNWMWQQILRGLLAGYQVNLWNGTHLTPAGWLWHLQQTQLNHSSKDWRLNTVFSSSSAEAFSLFMSSAEVTKWM